MRDTAVYPNRILLPDGRPMERISDIIHPAPITSFVGGGGKTSSMLALGTELAEQGNRVIMTTTTRILPFHQPLAANLSCIGERAENGKLGPVSNPDGLKQQCDVLLIEADGSKGLPMKAPAGHEPVLYERTDYVAAVYGLSALGKPLKEVCHRPERAAALLGRKPEDTVTGEDAAAILAHPEGQKKNVGERTYCVVLNQADDAERRKQAETIAAGLAVRGVERCLITFHQQEEL